MKKFFIHAVNVHQGGGKSLLMALLNVCRNDENVFALLDKRLTFPNNDRVHIMPVAPSVIQRFRSEIWLKNTVNSKDTVLCFGNLPPLFNLRGRVVVFLQNRYLVDEVSLKEFSFKIRMRLYVERMWFSLRKSYVDEFVVQTPSMKIMLEKHLEGTIPVSMVPFIESPKDYERSFSFNVRNNANGNFIYVASGEPHKNHLRLIDAWCLLASEGLYPNLKLTLDEKKFSMLCSLIKHKVDEYRLNVENVGYVSSDQIKTLLTEADALIYPSTLESFGLPLIEARLANISIIAAELNYVRDIVDPEQTFDPLSPISISRAVKRFLRKDEKKLHIENAAGFLTYVLKGCI